MHLINRNSSRHKNIQRMIYCPLFKLSSMCSFWTHSHHPASHQKRTLLNRLLFTSFNHFQTNIFNSFSSSNITSKTNITHNTSVHLFQSLSYKYFQLILIIQHHVKKRTLLMRLLFISFNHFQTNIFNSFSSTNRVGDE